jgi:hypothetical protein
MRENSMRTVPDRAAASRAIAACTAGRWCTLRDIAFAPMHA